MIKKNINGNKFLPLGISAKFFNLPSLSHQSIGFSSEIKAIIRREKKGEVNLRHLILFILQLLLYL